MLQQQMAQVAQMQQMQASLMGRGFTPLGQPGAGADGMGAMGAMGAMGGMGGMGFGGAFQQQQQMNSFLSQMAAAQQQAQQQQQQQQAQALQAQAQPQPQRGTESPPGRRLVRAQSAAPLRPMAALPAPAANPTQRVELAWLPPGQLASLARPQDKPARAARMGAQPPPLAAEPRGAEAAPPPHEAEAGAAAEVDEWCELLPA
jgi:hypothetical protein